MAASKHRPTDLHEISHCVIAIADELSSLASVQIIEYFHAPTSCRLEAISAWITLVHSVCPIAVIWHPTYTSFGMIELDPSSKSALS
jgi:hypothetical protein